MTHDEIKTELNRNHGACLGVLHHIVTMDTNSCFVVEVAVNHAKELIKQHDIIVESQRELWADESVDQDKWRGDHCGYLASQAMARIERGLTPTEEQAMALESENHHANAEYMLTIERAEYWEER